jgi:hypothetical protein
LPSVVTAVSAAHRAKRNQDYQPSYEEERMLNSPISFSGHFCLMATLLLVLAGCQAIAVPTAAPAATETPTVLAVESMTPLPLDQALAPTPITIPAVELDQPIVPMGWTIADVNGERTTKWVVPTDAVGWHVTSAGAGGAGRVVLSAHQAAGEAPFKPLALGEIVPDQEILLTDSEGIVFVYRVTEVSQPIPLTGATAEDEALAASYLTPSDEALLTLITGWPEFTTTHRVFAVAEFVGLQP